MLGSYIRRLILIYFLGKLANRTHLFKFFARKFGRTQHSQIIGCFLALFVCGKALQLTLMSRQSR